MAMPTQSQNCQRPRHKLTDRRALKTEQGSALCCPARRLAKDKPLTVLIREKNGRDGSRNPHVQPMAASWSVCPDVGAEPNGFRRMCSDHSTCESATDDTRYHNVRADPYLLCPWSVPGAQRLPPLTSCQRCTTWAPRRVHAPYRLQYRRGASLR